MGEPENEGCTSYILTHLRYMCEVVLKKTNKYENLLKLDGDDESKELGKKIIDLISLIEKNCQSFKQSWKHYHQKNIEDPENDDRNQETSMDFHSLSQTCTNAFYTNESFDIFENKIKQENKLPEDSISDGHFEENSITKKSNPSAKFRSPSKEDTNPDVGTEEEFDEAMSPILGRKVKKKDLCNSTDQEKEVIEDEHGTLALRVENGELSTDQLLQQLNEVIDSPVISDTIKSGKEIDNCSRETKVFCKPEGSFSSSPIILSSQTVDCDNDNRKYSERNESSNKNDILSTPTSSTSSMIKPKKGKSKLNKGKSFKNKKIPLKHKITVASSTSLTNKHNEEIELPDKFEVIDDPPFTSSLINSNVGEDETDCGNETVERKLTDSQETEIYSQALECVDNPGKPSMENNSGGVPSDEDDPNENEVCASNLFEQIWQQDTRDGLLELLPPLSQSFLNTESTTKLTLDNTNMHNHADEYDQTAKKPSEKKSDNVHLSLIQSDPTFENVSTTKSESDSNNMPSYTGKNHPVSITESLRNCEDASCNVPSRTSSPSLRDADNNKSLSDMHNLTEGDDPYNLIQSQDNTRDGLLRLLPPLSQSIFSDTISNPDIVSIQSYTEQEVQDALNELESSSSCSPPWSTSNSGNDSDDQDSENAYSLPSSICKNASLEKDDSLLTNTDVDDSEIEETASIEYSSIPADFDIDDFYKDEYDIKDCHVVLQKVGISDQKQSSGEKFEEHQYNKDEGVEMSGEGEATSSCNSYCTDNELKNEVFKEGDSLNDSMSEENMNEDCSLSSIASLDGSEIDDQNSSAKTLSIEDFDMVEFYRNLYNIEDCSVVLQKLQNFDYLNRINDKDWEEHSKDSVAADDIDEDEEIDRLCQIDSLERRRKSQDSDEEIGRKRTKESDIPPEEIPPHEISTDLSLEDCLENYNVNTELRTNEGDQHLADIVSNTIKDVDNFYESDLESVKEIKRKQKLDVQNSNTMSETKIQGGTTHGKDHWSRDPLLTCKISFGSNEKKSVANEMVEEDLNNKNFIHYKTQTQDLRLSQKEERESQDSDEEIGRNRTKESDIPPEEILQHEMSTDLSLEDCLENSNVNTELGTNEGNQHLADIVSNTIKDVDNFYESDLESVKEIKRKQKLDLQNSNAMSETKIQDGTTHGKDHWSRDPLLTCKISLDSNEKKSVPKEMVEEDQNNKNIIHYKKKIQDLSDAKMSDDTMSDDEMSSADEDLEFKTNEENEEMMSNIMEEPQLQTAQASDETETTKKKCRRNIKPVLTYEELAEATKRAEIEEEQRSFRIEQRQQFLSSQITEEDELILDTTKEGEKIKVDPMLCEKLYPHQRKGVMFMWQSCYESIERLQMFRGLGCILAHCMGLGKTFQVFTLLHTLFAHPITNMKHCLIICPVSTIIPWMKEIESGLELSSKKIDIIVEYIDATDNIINKCLKIKKWRQHSGILLMGYEAFVQLIFGKSVCKKIKDELLYGALLDPGPDLVVCDEGHLLKNGKAKRTQAVSNIKTRRRIILSGTPMQNNLNEYYYMVNFVSPNLLGTFKEYSNRFVIPITNGQYGDSTQLDIMLMKKRSHVLHKLLRNTVQRFEVSELNKYLEPIKNFTILTQLHPVQVSLYKYFIEQAKQHFTLSSSKSTNLFGDMNVAKYICSHPHLLSIMEEQIKKNKKNLLLNGEENVLKVEFIKKDWWKTLCSAADLLNIDCGPKLKLTLAIIEEAEKLCEKVLIFTSSLIELKSLEYFLKQFGTSHCKSWFHRKDYFRMDGSVPPSRRAKICSHFNNPANKRLRVLLVSYKVGGLGLTLTAANRVIILGSVFNPVHDTQSIYRCYRFGQTKTVYVYRLISMGTMEEKIYRRCVSKLALACRVVDKQQIDRHYDLSEIEHLYTDDIDLTSPKPSLSKPDDDLLATLILKFDFLHKYVDHQGLLENKPEDDLNDEDKERAWEEFRRECENQDIAAQRKQQAPNSEAILSTPSAQALTNMSQQSLLSNMTLLNAGPSQMSDPNINLEPMTENLHSIRRFFGNLSHRRADSLLPFPQFIHQQKGDLYIGSNRANSEHDNTRLRIVQAQNKPIDKRKKIILYPVNNINKAHGNISVAVPNINDNKNDKQGGSTEVSRKTVRVGRLTDGIQDEVLSLINKTVLDQKNFQPSLLKMKNKTSSQAYNEEQVTKMIPSDDDKRQPSTSTMSEARDLLDNAIKTKITPEVHKQFENLTDITVEPVVCASTKDAQKQTEPSNVQIFHDKYSIGTAGTSESNNTISKNNLRYENSAIDALAAAQPSVYHNSASTSILKMSAGKYNSGVYYEGPHNLKPDGVVQGGKVSPPQNEGIIVQSSKNSEIICASNANIDPKIIPIIPKSVGPRISSSKNVFRQMHNLNKPQIFPINKRQSNTNPKRLITKKTNVPLVKEPNMSNKNITNVGQSVLPQVSIKNPSSISFLTESRNSHIISGGTNISGIIDTSQKRVYPFSSDDVLHSISQNSPLDLSKRMREDSSIESTSGTSNEKTKNRGNLPTIKRKRKNVMKSLPYNMQKTVQAYQAIKVKKRKLGSTVISSVDQKEKQTNKVPKLKSVGLKKSMESVRIEENPCHSQTNDIPKNNASTITSTPSDYNQEIISSRQAPMVGSCRIVKVTGTH